MRALLLITGILLLIAAEILRVYFIMPFPGSQQGDTINIAYWLHKNIIWLRLLGGLLVIYPVIYVFRFSKIWKKMVLVAALLFYAGVFYLFNFRFLADKMFLPPKQQDYAAADNNRIPAEKLVIGVVINNEAKAYPIQLIGYHHQVRDTVGHTPVMVTYCTVCRTGRVFSPVINGQEEQFRLVGMDHFNAMFEDAATKSWWRQATGEAITGPLKGKHLQELPSQQLSLRAWLALYPNSLVLQADTNFSQQYAQLDLFDKGTINSGLEKRDSASWRFKSWVIGVKHQQTAKAYDWNELTSKQLIQDSIPDLPLLIVLDKDSSSFRVLDRRVNGASLQFVKGQGMDVITDLNTQSTWDISGRCLAGPLRSTLLKPVQAYQEFWHSWRTFHPNTLNQQLQ